MRDNELNLMPGLATSWQQVNPTTWRFTLRQGVKFHDGSPLTADDIVFSYERASHTNSQLRQYAMPVGKPRKIDDFTVEFVQDKPEPDHARTRHHDLHHEQGVGEKNKVEKPLDFKAKEETFASRNANGTGAWILESREPGVKTVLKSNPDWWGIKEGRAPATSPKWSTRRSAPTRRARRPCCRRQVDFVLDPPPQDVRRIEDAGAQGHRGPRTA